MPSFRHILQPILNHRSKNNPTNTIHNPAQMNKPKQNPVSPPNSSPSHSSDTDPNSPDIGLTHLIDGIPSTKKSKEEQDRELWNSVLTEGLVKPRNAYAKAFPYHPYLGNSQSARADSDGPLGKAAEDDVGVGSSHQFSGKGKEKAGLVNGDGEKKGDVQDKRHVLEGEGFKFTTRNETDDSGLIPVSQSRPQGNGTHEANSSIGAALSTPDIEQLEPAPAPSSPTTLTWSLALDHILSSGQIDPHILEALRNRLPEDAQPTPISTADIGLVPNFSYPIIASPFYDTPATRPRDTQPPPIQDTPNGPTENIPNGIPTPPPQNHTLPTGLPTTQEFTLLPSPPSASPPPSPTTQTSHLKGTIATQAKLIRDLHALLDGFRLRNEDLEERVIPQVLELVDGKAAVYGEIIEDLKEEIAELKGAVDFGNKVLGGCWMREWELWRWVREVSARGGGEGGFWGKVVRWRDRGRERRGEGGLVLREGYGWVDFDNGQDKGASRVGGHLRSEGEKSRALLHRWGEEGEDGGGVSRKELKAIAALAEQNLRILKEDVEEMVALVQRCKGRESGVRDVGEVSEGRYTVRDV